MEIQLVSGATTIVDDDDYEVLSRHRWYLCQGYVVRGVKGRQVRMHRHIMGDPDMFVDHKNRNKLDNRKENLRLCTPSQNQANKIKGNRLYSSKYKGVTKSYNNKWLAQVRKDGKVYCIGVFHTEISAALAYNEKAKELFGEFARGNEIPESEIRKNAIIVKEIEREARTIKDAKAKTRAEKLKREKSARIRRMFIKSAELMCRYTPPVKWKKIRTESRTRSEYLLRYKCRLRAEYAVKIGKMEQERCECCKAKDTIPYHEDYNYPYLVRWLCKSCYVDVQNYVVLPPKVYEERLRVKVEPTDGGMAIKKIRSLESIRWEEERRNKHQQEEALLYKKMEEVMLGWKKCGHNNTLETVASLCEIAEKHRPKTYVY